MLPTTDDPFAEFQLDCEREIVELGANREMQDATKAWFRLANKLKYSYHFTALGRPIIQYPQDIVAVQEMIWSVQPTVIIETGVAHGGSLILSAQMLATLDYVEAVKSGEPLDPTLSKRRVIGIDVEIRRHNRVALDMHPMRHKIELIEGSSVEASVVEKVRGSVARDDTVLVILDSNHSHDHVLQELKSYAPLVSIGSFCLVYDTIIEHLPAGSWPDRPWDVGSSPMTAIAEYCKYLQENDCRGLDGRPLNFSADKTIDAKLLISVAPGGYLRRDIA